MFLFLKQTKIKSDAMIKDVSFSKLKELIALIKGWTVPICGTNDFTKCQVCAGGVDTSELTEKCESKLHQGLYIVGELLDIDGICGGYNLQWAWSSGYVAGKDAAITTSRQ